MAVIGQELPTEPSIGPDRSARKRAMLELTPNYPQEPVKGEPAERRDCGSSRLV
jgi:hypothetical protein